MDEALRRGRIAEDELRLIVLTRLGGITFQELAAHDVVPIGRLRQRRLRAEQVLSMG